MEEKIKIGIDIDEVVAGFMKCFLEYSNLNYGIQNSLEDITNYHLWECGIHDSKEESIRKVEEFQDSEYFDKINFVGDSKRGIENISKKHKVYFITSRPEKLKDKTVNFFYSNFPKNGYSFVFSGEIYGGKTKAQICNELGIKLMIEDNADYALNCAKSGIKTFLLDKPWNNNYEKHENIIKVNNWGEILENLK